MLLTARTAFAILLGTIAASAQPPRIGNCNILPADNIWNTPVDTLPVAANSASFITTIGSNIGLKADFGAGRV